VENLTISGVPYLAPSVVSEMSYYKSCVLSGTNCC